jgi:hypothetical protein
MAENSSGIDVSLKNSANKTKRSILVESRGKKKLPRLLEKEFESTEMECVNNWKNIHLNFTDELVQQWQNHNFTYNQTQDWINIGLKSTEVVLATWIRNKVGITPKEVLNHGNYQELSQEFFSWWQQQQLRTQIE